MERRQKQAISLWILMSAMISFQMCRGENPGDGDIQRLRYSGEMYYPILRISRNTQKVTLAARVGFSIRQIEVDVDFSDKFDELSLFNLRENILESGQLLLRGVLDPEKERFQAVSWYALCPFREIRPQEGDTEGRTIVVTRNSLLPRDFLAVWSIGRQANQGKKKLIVRPSVDFNQYCISCGSIQLNKERTAPGIENGVAKKYYPMFQLAPDVGWKVQIMDGLEERWVDVEFSDIYDDNSLRNLKIGVIFSARELGMPYIFLYGSLDRKRNLVNAERWFVICPFYEANTLSINLDPEKTIRREVLCTDSFKKRWQVRETIDGNSYDVGVDRPEVDCSRYMLRPRKLFRFSVGCQ